MQTSRLQNKKRGNPLPRLGGTHLPSARRKVLPGSPPGWPPSSRPYCRPSTASLRPPRLAAAIGSGGARPAAPPTAKVGNRARRGRDPLASVGNGAAAGAPLGRSEKFSGRGWYLRGVGDPEFASLGLCYSCFRHPWRAEGGSGVGPGWKRLWRSRHRGSNNAGSGSPAIIPLA